MKFLISLKKIYIPTGAQIFKYEDDNFTEIVSSPDETERTVYQWIDYILDNTTSVSSIDLDVNEFTGVYVFDIDNNPTVTFIDYTFGKAIGFSPGYVYNHDHNIESGMYIYGNYWGLARLLIQDEDGSINSIGTDGNIFQPHKATGGWTIAGQSYRPINKLNTVFWKLTSYGMTIKQAEEALKFFENIGSNVDLVMKPECFDVFDKLIFQVLAHEDYLSVDDTVGYYKIEFELSERYGSGYVTLNNTTTALTLNNDITFLTRS